MVGINATRLFSVLYSETLNVGRVMTPTLGMVVMREAAISAFKSEPFYTVQIIFPDFSAASERIKEKGEAEEILKKCKRNGKAVVTGVEQKNRWEKAPALYDLTSLQRDANRVLGYTAQQTLDYTQSLYEKKLVTYPRTDSRYLTSDMSEKISGLVSEVAKSLGSREEIVVNAAQVINNRKVSDHHAIIPTQSMTKADWKGLPLGERAVLKLIAVRLLAAVSKAHGYAETTMELDCAGVTFSAKGKAVREGGWKRVEALFCSESKSKEERNLPIVSKGDVLDMESTEIKEGKTTPPKHFTEDTLLQAMESAGSDEMPTEAERKGIGTPATRSGIIEKLVQKGFMERKGDNKVKHLIPTEKGIALIMVMPEQIQSASMTADWEEKLLRIERQDYEADAFLQEIEEMITLLVKNYKVVKGADVFMSKNAVVGKCPHCGSEVVERQKGWFCGNRECRFILWKDNGYFNQIGKKLTPHIVDELLRDGRTKLKDCKSKRTGKNYDATVLLFTEADGRAKFHMEFKNGGKE